MRPLGPSSDSLIPSSYSVRPTSAAAPTRSEPPSPPRRDSFATSDEALFSAAVNRLLGEVLTLTEGARRLRVLAANAEVRGADLPISAVLRALDTAAMELEMVARTRGPGSR